MNTWAKIFITKEAWVALLALAGITAHLILRYIVFSDVDGSNLPLLLVVVLGGGVLITDLVKKFVKFDFGSDLLAGISIITALILGEYLAGALVVLMLSGGTTLEAFVVAKASSALTALAKRMPTFAHRQGPSALEKIKVEEIRVGDSIVILPHEIAPCDGEVIDGHSSMDEAYLTGEPFLISKSKGSQIISGAINGEGSLTVRATKPASESRYAQIATIMKESEQARIPLRRLADKLGAWYTPLALIIGIIAYLSSGESIRFLAVLVVATPCPLIISIPVAIIGSVSLAAKNSIIIKDPAVLERIDTARVVILDKTGTLTYGLPELIEQKYYSDFDSQKIFKATATLEQYSKHPLAKALLAEAKKRGLTLGVASEMSELPGRGLVGVVEGLELELTSRKALEKAQNPIFKDLPATESGLECVVLANKKLAAFYQFRDTPREDSKSFISHLPKRHNIKKTIIVSGDRESEVRYLADLVGIKEFYFSKSPEEKVNIVREQTAKAETVYIGDGINDAPALLAATIGVGFGSSNDVTSQAASVVIMEPSLRRVDEFFHISLRMKRIALQSAIGGMTVSTVAMIFAAYGSINPVFGALIQEIIDLFAVLNALRAAYMPEKLTDYS